MKRYELVQIADYLKKYRKIGAIFRVDDTILKVVFDKDSTVFFDLKRGDSYVFKCDKYKVSKNYTAPFDIVLKKRCNSSFIKNIEVFDEDKVLRFELELKKSYKSTITYLQLEFTGRHTNIIIMDQDLIVLEALRHIDKTVSYRVVQCGSKLEKLPPYNFKENFKKIEDIENFLYKEHKERESKKVYQLINQKLILIAKKKEKLQNIKDSLPMPKELEEKSKIYQNEAKLLLSNLHNIKNYQKEIELCDFDGNLTKIVLPKEAKTPSQAADMMFKAYKKILKKSKNIDKERENIDQKIKFLNSLENIVKNIKSADELRLYFPKKTIKQKKQKSFDAVENFYFMGYKISLGKNEKANAHLLKNSKMSDIWLHLKDIPSTHVIIRSDKKDIPKDVIEFGADLCVKFSTTQKGSYLVDFTKRRNVRVESGAKVHYVEYNSIKITI